jgi:hypothetical protein
MIKRIFVFVVAVAMAFSASAQSEVASITWQPNVGVTHTSAIVEGRNSVLDGAYGITFGVEAMYMLKEKLGIALGLNYTGYNLDDDAVAYFGYSRYYSYYGYNYNGSLYERALNPDYQKARNFYFNIPVTANFYIFKGFAVKGGIAFNILSTAKIGGDSELNFGREAVKVRDLYKSVFISAPIGVSYEIKNIVFDARYSVSITNVSDYGEATYLPLSLTVGYKF